MNIKKIFRMFILLSIILPFLGFSYSTINVDSQSPKVQELISWHGYGGIFDIKSEEMSDKDLVLFSALTILILITLIGCVGFYLFKKWGRTILVASGMLSLIFLPFNGITVELAFESALYELSSILFGAVIAMSYLPPLSEQFENT